MLINLLVWIIVGGIAGWLASLLVQGTGMGIVGDVIVGIVGALDRRLRALAAAAGHIRHHWLQPGQPDRRLHRRGDPALHRQALHWADAPSPRPSDLGQIKGDDSTVIPSLLPFRLRQDDGERSPSQGRRWLSASR